MLPETILIPKSIKEAEDRFVIKVKEQFLTIIKEVNRLEKRIATIKEFTGLEDLLDKIRGKANVDASNVGQNGDIDTTGLWGEALGVGEVREINNKLVNGSTVYKEVRPPGMLIAYNYIAEQKTTADNLISLDTKLKEVDDEVKSIVMPTFDTSGLARINLANIDYDAEAKINGIARSSIEIKPAENSNMTITKVLEGKVETYYLKAHGTTPDLSIYALKSSYNVGAWGLDEYSHSYIHEENLTTAQRNNMIDWGKAIGIQPLQGNQVRIDEMTPTSALIEPVRAYDQGCLIRIDDQRLSSVGLLTTETRRGYSTFIKNLDGFDEYSSSSPSTRGQNLSFVDGYYSSGVAIKELNKGLVDTVNGLNVLWDKICGNEGSGSPYFADNSSHQSSPYRYSFEEQMVDSGQQGSEPEGTGQYDLTFYKGNTKLNPAYHAGTNTPIDIAVQSWIDKSSELVTVSNFTVGNNSIQYYKTAGIENSIAQSVVDMLGVKDLVLGNKTVQHYKSYLNNISLGDAAIDFLNSKDNLNRLKSSVFGITSFGALPDVAHAEFYDGDEFVSYTFGNLYDAYEKTIKGLGNFNTDIKTSFSDIEDLKENVGRLYDYVATINTVLIGYHVNTGIPAIPNPYSYAIQPEEEEP